MPATELDTLLGKLDHGAREIRRRLPRLSAERDSQPNGYRTLRLAGAQSVEDSHLLNAYCSWKSGRPDSAIALNGRETVDGGQEPRDSGVERSVLIGFDEHRSVCSFF